MAAAWSYWPARSSSKPWPIAWAGRARAHRSTMVATTSKGKPREGRFTGTCRAAASAAHSRRLGRRRIQPPEVLEHQPTLLGGETLELLPPGVPEPRARGSGTPGGRSSRVSPPSSVGWCSSISGGRMHLSGRLPSHSEEWARQSIALKDSVVLGSGFSLGILGLILSVLVVRPLPAQAIGQGFELERAGQYDQAAAIYFATLRAEPTNLSALLGLELAELRQLAGDAEGAAREWAAALIDAPVQLPNAASALAEAPDAQRERIARLLTEGTPSTLTRRLAGELLLNWGQPLRAWAVFEPSVATPSADAAFAARRFADLAGARSTPDARRARALALARYADLAPEVGGAAARARADAARAFIEAGDRVAARAVLERVAQDSNAPPDAQRLAQRAVVEALIEGGQRNEAA